MARWFHRKDFVTRES